MNRAMAENMSMSLMSLFGSISNLMFPPRWMAVRGWRCILSEAASSPLCFFRSVGNFPSSSRASARELSATYVLG